MKLFHTVTATKLVIPAKRSVAKREPGPRSDGLGVGACDASLSLSLLGPGSQALPRCFAAGVANVRDDKFEVQA